MYYYSKNSRRKIVHSECCHFRRILNPEDYWILSDPGRSVLRRIPPMRPLRRLI